MATDALSGAQRRATHHGWYLYREPDPLVRDVRAVVEVETGEKFGGDGGPTRDARRVFIAIGEVRDYPEQQCELLEEHIQSLSDEKFAELIRNGLVIPIAAASEPNDVV